MKRIIEMASPKGGELKNQNDKIGPVKLRLKAGKEPDDQDLALIVSSSNHNQYIIACNYAQELILNIYEEYKGFCA
jgi:hypothetical protein